MNKIFTLMRETNTARFFIPLGLILIIFGIIVFNINTKNQNYIKTEATVSNVEISEEAYTDVNGDYVEATYNVTINYTVDSKNYSNTLENVSKYKKGEKVSIYYNPNDPSQITQSKSLILPIIIVVAGIGSLIGGIISLINSIKRHKKMIDQERKWNNE